jgi:ribonuclease E
MTEQDHPADSSSPEPVAADPPETGGVVDAFDDDSLEPVEAGAPSAARNAARRQRRGSRGGKGRRRPAGTPSSNGDGPATADAEDDEAGDDDEIGAPVVDDDVELPDLPNEGRVQDPQAAAEALVRKPQIGDSRPAPEGRAAATRPVGRSAPAKAASVKAASVKATSAGDGNGATARSKRRRKSPTRAAGTPAKAAAAPAVLDQEALDRRRGRERKGRPVGRYLMCVHVRPELVQIAVLEGRNLIEHYVSRPSDDVAQIHGNIYLGRVQNVLPGMEAAFVDIGTPKNAVLYRGDVQYDSEDLLESPKSEKGRPAERPRIEQLLKNKQLIVTQVTKNPIGAKGARLTQEVSLPGRFVVLIPNSRTYGISKRLADEERRRLRSILDRVKPEEHGLIVRTAAENVSEEELRADVLRLVGQWEKISAKAKQAKGPALLYREPGLAVRVIREELNADYRGVIIDDPALYAEVSDYVGALNPELASRIEHYDPQAEGLPLFERHHVHEQVHKALDRKVWLPSGGSLIIEHTEALTVIDVNTGKNVGSSNLEETVFNNNLEAADEIARQLRLRDIGGIIVIDFIDMEIRENRQRVVNAFRDALARDKTRTQVFDISELGLVEMTRKRIGEGLLTAFAHACPNCDGRGLIVDQSLIS